MINLRLLHVFPTAAPYAKLLQVSRDGPYIGDSQQPNDLISHHQNLAQNHQELHKPLSKDQKYRQRLKAREQEKNGQRAKLISENKMLKDEVAQLRSDNKMLRSVTDEQFARLGLLNEMLISYYEQLARLISEIEMLRNNKDEQFASFIWEIEKLRKEIASIKH
ncbi:hypothetical protein V6N11_048899 [Hibiscus sabdariffa]|uniref:BZIP domain-containing protein n=1 Tax=Hibiscus sabdariffa TaxID=183260 RepID=A0ABR2PWM4_9ROSI